MSITVTSTTDSQEAVTAAQGNLAKPTVDKAVTAPPPEEAQKIEAKDATSNEEVKEEKEVGKEGDKPEEKPKKKGGFKKRIEKLNIQKAKAESEAQYWRNEAMKNQRPPAEKVADKVEAKVDGKPDPEKFESHEAYVEALADWKVDQKLSAREKKDVESKLKSDFDSKVKTHAERVQAFSKQHEDFSELMESVDDIPMSPTVQHAILESEDGPGLMYELAKNREEYARICKLPALQAAREIGKFEAKFLKSASATSVKKEIETTKAPPPIAPVGTKASSTKSPEEMSFAEYKAWRAQT